MKHRYLNAGCIDVALSAITQQFRVPTVHLQRKRKHVAEWKEERMDGQMDGFRSPFHT